MISDGRYLTLNCLYRLRCHDTAFYWEHPLVVLLDFLAALQLFLLKVMMKNTSFSFTASVNCFSLLGSCFDAWAGCDNNYRHSPSSSAPLIRVALISADDCNYLIIEKINKISHLTAPADALSLSDLELNLCNICKRWRKIARSKTGAQD